MNLAALLAELRALTDVAPAAPDAAGQGEAAGARVQWARILELMRGVEGLADAEVARFFLRQRVGDQLRSLAKSDDPRERRLAMSLVKFALPRSEYAGILRRATKDTDSGVRVRAMAATIRLGIQDVALPDPRKRGYSGGDLYAYAWAREHGDWGVMGWRFGLNPGLTRRSGRGKKHPREDLVEIQKALPPLANKADVYKLLGLKKAANIRPFMRPGAGAGAGYVRFTVPKATGGERVITAPKKQLKALQRSILRGILDKIPPHPACHGFVVGRSVVTNAEPHQKAKLVVKVDISDFFPTITYTRVHGLFTSYGAGDEAASILAALTTHRSKHEGGFVAWPGVLPQGAPTSPAIANLVCRRMDARLLGLGARYGCVYTRYADDLTFSFKEEPAGLGRFLWWVDQILQQEGFAQNVKKRRVLRRSNQQRVTGIVVNDGLRLPRDERRRLRAMIDECRKKGLAAASRGREGFAEYLLGMASYLKMVEPARGAAMLAEIRDILQNGKGSGSGGEGA